MPLGLGFWIIILVLVLFTGAGALAPVYALYAHAGTGFITLVLFVVVGCQIFWPPIQRGP